MNTAKTAPNKTKPMKNDASEDSKMNPPVLFSFFGGGAI